MYPFKLILRKPKRKEKKWIYKPTYTETLEIYTSS